MSKRKFPKAVRKMPEEAVETIVSWYDADFAILQDHLKNLSQLVLLMVRQSEDNHDPEFMRQAILLSHLHEDLETFVV